MGDDEGPFHFASDLRRNEIRALERIAAAGEATAYTLGLLVQQLQQPIHVIIDSEPAPSPSGAVTSIILIGGPAMPTVDTTGQFATQSFTDDKGDADSAPAGLVEAWSSDNTAVATVDPATGALTYLSVGSANISVANSGAFLPAGVTAFPSPPSAAVTVTPGLPVASTITIADAAPPAPAPTA